MAGKFRSDGKIQERRENLGVAGKFKMAKPGARGPRKFLGRAKTSTWRFLKSNTPVCLHGLSGR